MRVDIPRVNKRIYKRDSKTDHIIFYDLDNRYPQRMLDIINASGTATRATETYHKFIHGGGFKDKAFYRAIINTSGLTADKLLKAASKDYAHYGGRSYHVNYNGLLQISEVHHIPFEYCRIGSGKKEGMIAVYNDWECSLHARVQHDKIKWYHRFTTDPILLQDQIAECGGILEFEGAIYTDTKYPLSPIDPVIEDVISDKSIKTFTQKELLNGFRPAAIVQYPKEFESDEEWGKQLSIWETFQGPENANKIIVTSGTADNKVSIDKFDSANNDKMYDSTNIRVKDSIIQRFGIPPSLIGRRDNTAVFSSQNIEDDTKFYNSITTAERLLFEEDMKILFSNFERKLNDTDDWSILELQFDAYSTEIPSLISKIGLEATQALISVLEQKTETSLPNDQKINLLQMAFGLTTQQAQSLVLGIKI